LHSYGVDIQFYISGSWSDR